MNVSIKALSSLFIFILASITITSHAKMRPRSSYQTSELIQKFTSDHQKREIAVLAKELFSVEKIYSYAFDQDSVSLQDLKTQITNDLGSAQKWNGILSSQKMDLIKKHKANLLTVFGEKSMVWSWVQFQLNDKKKSKLNLSALFEEQHKNVMAINELGLNRSPMSELESSFEVLKMMSSEKEISYFREKIREAKKHISNLPRSNILT